MKETSLSRRQFLKTTLISAGTISVLGLTGCGGSSSSSRTRTAEAAFYFPQSVASGDPKSDSIILWTRAENIGSYAVALQVSTDAEFGEENIAVSVDVTSSINTDNDNCLKVKVTGLTSGTTYYYRFVIYNGDNPIQTSNTGRFKTAGATDNTAPVKFAFLSCQDYTGRYYNSLFSLLSAENDDMDFVLHLGDYIYETTGDPSFQNTEGRRVEFSAPEEALEITQDGSTFLAAQSLGNYRDIYKTYRSDEALQQLHEKFAFVSIWDDHEFSDDSWQDNGTYLGNETGEQDAIRKANAARAFFEFQPVDLDGSGSALTGSDLGNGVADNSTVSAAATSAVNRSLRFGKHVNLNLADYRTHRPDHLIPEDAFPGEVVMDQATTVSTLMATQGIDSPTATAFAQANFYQYIDTANSTYPGVNGTESTASLVGIDAVTPANNGALTQALISAYTQAYTNAGVDAASAASSAFDKVSALLAGNPKLDVVSINATLETAAVALETAGDSASAASLRDAKVDDGASLSHGVSYAQMGKQSVAGSSLGSRYLVIKASYDLYSAYLSQTDSSRDDAWGSAQTTSILSNMSSNTDATWQVLGSSVSFATMLLNGGLLAETVDNLVPGASALIPAQITDNTFYLNVDQWDGFPVRRGMLMGDIDGGLSTTLKAQNAVILSGDIHSSFATDHGVDSMGNRAVEFTVAGVSSANFGDLLSVQAGALLADNTAAAPLISALPLLLDGLLTGASEAERLSADMAEQPAMQDMKHASSTINGVAVLTATADQLTATYYHYSDVLTDQYANNGFTDANPVEQVTFTVAKTEGKNGEVTEVL